MDHMVVYWFCRKYASEDKLQDAPISIPLEVRQEVLKYPPKPSQVYDWMMKSCGFYEPSWFKEITGTYWRNRTLKRPVKPYVNPALEGIKVEWR